MTPLFHFGISGPQAFDVADQQIAATVGERKREEKRPPSILSRR